MPFKLLLHPDWTLIDRKLVLEVILRGRIWSSVLSGLGVLMQYWSPVQEKWDVHKPFTVKVTPTVGWARGPTEISQKARGLLYLAVETMRINYEGCGMRLLSVCLKTYREWTSAESLVLAKATIQESKLSWHHQCSHGSNKVGSTVSLLRLLNYCNNWICWVSHRKVWSFYILAHSSQPTAWTTNKKFIRSWLELWCCYDVGYFCLSIHSLPCNTLK